MKAITNAWPARKGVIQYIVAPSKAATKAPTNQARAEKLRLIWRASGRRRSQRLASSCATCAAAATTTRKNSRKAPRPS